MITNSIPLAGTVVLEALYKLRPAALGDPRVGICACLDNFTKHSRGGEEEEDEELKEDIFLVN